MQPEVSQHSQARRKKGNKKRQGTGKEKAKFVLEQTHCAEEVETKHAWRVSRAVKVVVSNS
jgi:hypothetical protein